MISTQIRLIWIGFSIFVLILFFNNNVQSSANFTEAVKYCGDVSNDIWIEDERTYQDKCIDDFMIGRVGSSIFEIFYW